MRGVLTLLPQPRDGPQLRYATDLSRQRRAASMAILLQPLRCQAASLLVGGTQLLPTFIPSMIIPVREGLRLFPRKIDCLVLMQRPEQM